MFKKNVQVSNKLKKKKAEMTFQIKLKGNKYKYYYLENRFFTNDFYFLIVFLFNRKIQGPI